MNTERTRLKNLLKQLEAAYAACFEDDNDGCDQSDSILTRIHAVEDKLERVYGVRN